MKVHCIERFILLILSEKSFGLIFRTELMVKINLDFGDQRMLPLQYCQFCSKINLVSANHAEARLEYIDYNRKLW